MADGAEAKKSNILQFKPKKPKTLASIKKAMPPAEKRRISQPVFIAPMKGKACAFKSSCTRDCIEPTRAAFTDEVRVKLALNIEHWLRSLNKLRNPDKEEFREKKKCAWEATWALEGSVIPLGGIGGGYNCVCGKPYPGTTGMKSMQVFTAAQMKEVVRGLELRADLTGAYVSLENGPVSGLHPDFAVLLTRFANLELPDEKKALNILMGDGGLNGIRVIARMASEPTVPHLARMEYVWAMDRIISSAIFNGEKAEVVNDYLALALSRFYAVEERVDIIEGSPYSWFGMRKDAPQMGSRPYLPNLKQMVAFSISEFFQAVVNMSARVGEIGSAPGEPGGLNREAAKSIYRALKQSLVYLAGEEMANKEMLWEFCERKKHEYEGDELHPGEQGMAKYLLRKMWAEDLLDADSVDAMLEVLNAEDIDAEKYVKELGLETD